MEREVEDFGYRKDNWKRRSIGFLGEIHCWRLKYRRHLTGWMRGLLSILDSRCQVLSLNSAKSLEGRHLSQDQGLCLQRWLRRGSRSNRELGIPSLKGSLILPRSWSAVKATGVQLQIFLSFLRECYVTKVLLEPWGRGQIEQCPLHPPKVLAFLALPFFLLLEFYKVQIKVLRVTVDTWDGWMHTWVDEWVRRWMARSFLAVLFLSMCNSPPLSPGTFIFSTSLTWLWVFL